MADFDLIDRWLLPQFQSIVQSWIPGGRMKGREYVVRNPTRADSEAKSFSINTSTGVWKDFATGEGGPGPLKLYAYIKRMEIGDAAKELTQTFRIDSNSKPPEPVKKNKETWYTVVPVPPGSPAAPEVFPRFENDKWVEYPIVDRWAYLNEDGLLCGYDVKIINHEGKKEILPLTYCKTKSGEYKWKFLHFKGKRPLYNLDRIKSNPTAILIGVEGCKKARALQDLLDAAGNTIYVTTTWPGGCESVHLANWNYIKGRILYEWPDNDRKVYPDDHEKAGTEKPKEEQPGYKAALQILKLTKTIAKSQKLIEVPGVDKPDTWDVADAIYIDKWTLDQVLGYIDSHLIDPPKQSDDETDQDIEIQLPFKVLGYNGPDRYYLMTKPWRIKSIGENSHSCSTLLTLATREFWRQYFPGQYGVNWESVASHLLHHQDAKRAFDLRNKRGRGGHMDNGRTVYHMGTYLIVDGKARDSLELENSSYVYEESYLIDADIKNPLPDEESQKVLSLIDKLHFVDTSMASLLSGYIALAPICGALSWRPHVWLTGGPGTGKSNILEKLIIPCVGSFSLFAGADSTASGMRQFAVTDGAPIIFDESEGQTKKGILSVQEVLKIARQASSNTGSRVFKGTASHKAIEFEPRSMFLLASTGVNIFERADETRFSIAELCIPKKMTQHERTCHWDKLKSEIYGTLTPKFCSALRARSILNMRTIRDNCNIFSNAVSERLADKRAGDQYGTLLAGEYSLFKMKTVTIEEAREIVGTYSFNQIYDKGREDHEKLLDFILQAVIRVNNTTELSIEEIIQRIIKRPDTNSFTTGMDESQVALYELLKRHGIRIDNAPAFKDKWIMWISDSHGGIARLLEETSWPKKWSLILKRLPGALTTAAMRFIGSPTRATGVPLETIMETE